MECLPQGAGVDLTAFAVHLLGIHPDRNLLDLLSFANPSHLFVKELSTHGFAILIVDALLLHLLDDQVPHKSRTRARAGLPTTSGILDSETCNCLAFATR